MAIIEIKDFSYQYPISEDFALKNINLTVEKGELVALVGKNGGGKTTLCNAIRGFVPHFYKGTCKGDIIIDGVNIKDASIGQLALKVGYIFQNPFNQISYIKDTVYDEVAYGLENFGVEPDDIRRRTDLMVERVKIEHLKEKSPFELSGGQQQRVALASILVMEPDILVVDEPTSQLDPQGTEEVFEVIDLVKREGKTVILVEHKVELLAEYADRVIVIDDGSIVMNGKAQEVLSNPEIEKHGMQLPKYALLGHELKKAGIDIAEIPITEEQAVSCIGEILKRRG